jgi:hypothetical protein
LIAHGWLGLARDADRSGDQAGSGQSSGQSNGPGMRQVRQMPLPVLTSTPIKLRWVSTSSCSIQAIASVSASSWLG